MFTLLTYPSGFGQFSLSPFCVKAACLLAKSGRKWRRQDVSDPRRMPHQKLPVLKTEARVIADSDSIRSVLESDGVDFDAGLTDEQRAFSRALIRMAEEHLYFHLVLDRWENPKAWPAVRETYFKDIPPLLRGTIAGALRKNLLKGLKTHGIGRFTPSERMQRIEADLGALRTLLQRSDYLFGSQPTAADLSVAPVLAAMRSNPVKTVLRNRIEQDEVFSNYLSRVDRDIVLP